MQVKINNWNINYEVMGEGNPVVLLHGWLANLETMRPIANNLSQNFKVYLVDVIGFGKSDLPEHPLNTNNFGDFLKEFLNTLKIKNPILIGHSNGGRTIINAVGRKIVTPKKIILIDSAGLKPKRKLSYYLKVAFYKTGKFFLNLLPNTKKVKAFKETVDITGIILTKLDGTAKGGVVIGITNENNMPVKYIGVGEKIDDMEKFNSEDFVNALID